ncbi:MAG TPA: cyclic nucleotide-binding domain-containing protein [Actinomycetota bacterium]
MEYALVAIVVGVAVAIIVSDVVARRRRVRGRIDVPALLAGRVAEPPRPAPDVPSSVRRELGEPRSHLGPAETGEEDGLGGVWALVEDAVDLEGFRPKVAAGTEIKYFRLRWGDDYALVAKADRSAHYELQVWEARLVEGLDGTRAVGEIVVDRLAESGDLDVGAVAGLIESLRRVGIFEPAPIDLPEILTQRLDESSASRRRLRAFMKDLRITWHGSDRLVRAVYDGGARYLFKAPVIALAAIVAAVGLVSFVFTATSGKYELVVGRASAQTIVLIALGFVLTAAHELGHAATLVHFGRRVRGAGFLLYYGSPAFFIDTSDGLMLGRRGRILQAAAGPFAEAALAGIASLLLLVLPPGSVTNLLYKFAIINYYVIFLNLIPLLELDGYWILADAIEEPELRPRSIAFIRREMWQKLARRERFSLQEVGFGVYGIVGILFTILTSVVGLLLWREVFGGIIVELWNSGLWTRLLMVALVLFFAGPAIRGLLTLARATGRRFRALWRRIRFRVETSWRVEAASLIDALPAFDDLPVDVLNDLAGRVQLRTVARGHTVFRQGDRADAFYVVRRGQVAIEDADPETGDTRTLRILERGDSFGEGGLLEGGTRQAAARALEETEVFRVDKNVFDRLLADQIDAPEFAPTMQAYAELHALPPFQRLATNQLAELLAHGGFVSAQPGDTIVRQGEPGDAFYVVASGRAEVVQDGAVLGEIGPGGHFGEIALLEDVPRTASVVARAPLRAFRLDREGFDAVLLQAFRAGTIRRATDRTAEH